MATVLNNGLLLFSRDRCKLRPPKDRYSHAPVTDVSWHHGGPVGPPRMTFARASETWRQWQVFHQEGRGWDDIGYNLGIDGLGRLYAGRPISAIPAAVGGHNTGMVGIVLMRDGRLKDDRGNKLPPLTPGEKRTIRILYQHGIPKLGLVPINKLVKDPRDGYGSFCHRWYSGHETNECPGQYIERHIRWRNGEA